MTTATVSSPVRRGRPPNPARGFSDTRQQLIRCGVELLTERSFSSTGIDAVVRHAGVPKGSFYHYFASKQEYGLAVLAAYDAYFCSKLDRHLLDDATAPLERIVGFTEDAQVGLERYDYARGCLVGNLGQEVAVLPPAFRARIAGIFSGWEARLARCLQLAQSRGDFAASADCDRLAAYFWIGWEGAVLRARLERSPAPLQLFVTFFLNGLHA